MGEEPPPELSALPSEEQVRQFNQWNERDKRGIFFLSQNISNSMIGHIQELTTSKQVWDTLERLYFTSTKARKIQLKSELNNLRKSPSITINDYILRVKEWAYALGSIGSILDDDDLIAYTWNGLKDDDKWKAFTTPIYVREHVPDFDQLVSLMITKEMNLQGSYPEGNQPQVLYAGSRGRGRFERGQQGRGRGR